MSGKPDAGSSAQAAPTAQWQPFHDGRSAIATDFELSATPSCFREQLGFTGSPTRAAAMVPPRRGRRAEVVAVEIVRALARGDFAVVARHVAEKGLCVRGSPSGQCVHLGRADVLECAQSKAVREWGWQSANEADTHAVCREAMVDLVPRSFTGVREGRVNCPEVIAFTLNGDSVATTYIQFFSSDASSPWQAITLGFVGRADKLTLVELIAARWLP